MKPNSLLHQVTISSAKRDRCMPVIAAAARNSIAKSRSETASSEFAAGPVKAERGGGRVTVDRKGGPGECRRTERAFVEAAPAIGEPAAVAPEHLDIGQQVMTEGHRLGDLQMGVARHHRGGFGLGAVDQRLLQVAHTPHRGDRSRRAATAENRSRPGRCATARCGGAPPPARSARRGALRYSCECLRVRR